MDNYEDDALAKYPTMGFLDRIWWREANEEFGLGQSVEMIGWAALYSAAMQDGEALEQVAARLIENGSPQVTTIQALRNLRRLCRRLGRVYAREEMGHGPSEHEVIQRLRSLSVPIAV